MNRHKLIYSLFGLGILFYAIVSCNSAAEEVAKSEAYLEGELIAKRVCGSCHRYTSPELLDATTWPNLLSAMQSIMKAENQMPEYDDWIKVQRFYLLHSPKQLKIEKITRPAEQSRFHPTVWKSDSTFHSRSTLLYYDDVGKELVIGQQNGDYLRYDAPLFSKNFALSNIPVAAKDSYVLGMGTLGPSDDVNGTLYKYEEGKYDVIVTGMNRAVDFQLSDLNNNGINEFVISSFGSGNGPTKTGELILVYQQNGEYVKRTLDSLTGPTMSKIVDLNNDGLSDIVTSFSQGNEYVKVYYNQGDLKFKSEVLVDFLPVYGLNSFDLKDIDGDGDLDLLTTNGDNDDYSQSFKPYHGVRLFLNDGAGKFESTFFYFINGANKVISEDFDLDGDADFVVLAMYPDLFTRPWETLIYFENEGHSRFKAHYFENVSTDNWILMDVGDIDQDGDMDIMTAANQGIHGLIPRGLMKEWKTNNRGLQVWENQTIN